MLLCLLVRATFTYLTYVTGASKEESKKPPPSPQCPPSAVVELTILLVGVHFYLNFGCLTLGGTGVGRTSLLSRISEDSFSEAVITSGDSTERTFVWIILSLQT